jgi:hypothetical protein
VLKVSVSQHQTRSVYRPLTKNPELWSQSFNYLMSS